jgi:hypothetical protein
LRASFIRPARACSSKKTTDSTLIALTLVVKSGTAIGINCETPIERSVSSTFAAFSLTAAVASSSNDSLIQPTRSFFTSSWAFQLNGMSDTLMSRPSGFAIACMTMAQSSA